MASILKLVILAFVSLVLVACESVESSDLATSGIYMDINVTDSPSNRLEVDVSLRTSSSATADAIELTGGDELFATLAGQHRKLSSKSSGYYSTDLPYQPGTLTVSLIRSEQASSEGSTLEVPKKTTLENVGASELSQGNSVINFRYDGPVSTNAITANFSVNCPETNFPLGSRELVITDNQFDLVDLLDEYNADKVSEVSKLYIDELVHCELAVVKSIPSVQGTVDNALKGGNFSYTVDSVSLTFPIVEPAP